MIDNYFKDLDITPYFIDISTKPGMVTFLPKKNIKDLMFKVVDGDTMSVLGGGHNQIVRDAFGEEVANSRLTNNIDVRKPFKFKRLGLSDGYNNLYFFLVECEDGDTVIYCDKRSVSLSAITDNINAQEMKIGRFVRIVLNESKYKFTDKEIEDFVNQYIAQLQLYTDPDRFLKIVEGKDIRKWYHENKYLYNNGQLGKSCMRYSECQGFFQIYEENSDKCKMLIFESEDKLAARALIWTTDSGEQYMDRVYTAKDSFKNVFTQYAIQNNMLYMNGYRNGRYDREVIVMKDKEEVSNDLKITLENTLFDKYPYMDSFRFLKENTISIKRVNGENYKDMISTNGNPYNI